MEQKAEELTSRKFIATLLGMLLVTFLMWDGKLATPDGKQAIYYFVFMGTCILGYGIINILDAIKNLILLAKTQEPK